MTDASAPATDPTAWPARLTPSSEMLTAEEERALTPFFTNTSRSVVALRNLPEATKGALFSRYSRTAKGVRRLFLDEFLANSGAGAMPTVAATSEGEATLAKAAAFYDRVLSDYGDDSVGELGGAHIAFQEISQIAAKAIEDSRIGASYLEKSTRYVRFDDKQDGRYKYYRDRRLLASPLGDEFVTCMDLLFDLYAQSFPLMTAHLQAQFPVDDVVFDNALSGQSQRLCDMTDEEFRRSALSAYGQALRARVCDSLRCFLPLASLTNVGVYANGRTHEYILTKLFADPLDELQTLAAAAAHELGQVIGPFIRRANNERGQAHQAYLRRRRQTQAQWAESLPTARSAGIGQRKVTLARYDRDAVDNIVAAILYPFADESESDLLAAAAALPAAAKRQIIADYVGERTNRRHKPGRAFERASYVFDLCLNIGEYRDLQRHRVCTPQRQQFTTALAFDTNPDVAAVPAVREAYEQAMQRAHELYARLHTDFPFEAQYTVPMGYRMRYSIQMNLREAYHLIELRSGEAGHRDYRQTAQEMYRAIMSVHPELAAGMSWVNLTPDVPMGRLRAEMRSARRRMGQG